MTLKLNIYTLLKQNVGPIGEQSDTHRPLELPFDIKQNVRKEALKERLEQIFEIDGFAYKRLNGYSGPDINNIEFPYIIEIMIFDIPNYTKSLHLLTSINLSPSLYPDSFTEEDRNKKIFTWTTTKGNEIKKITFYYRYSK